MKPSMLRRTFLRAAAASALADTSTGAAGRNPNVLFILAAGWRGQALPDSDPNLRTPNLARLTKQGIQLERAYTSYPLSGPSRAALLTGRFPHACGVTNNDAALAPDQPSIARELSRAGYDTGFVGEWALDGGEPPDPRSHGFEFSSVSGKESFNAGSETNLAIRFLQQKRRNPFFLLLTWRALPPFSGRLHANNPIDLRPNVPDERAATARAALAAYYAHCAALDANLGRLLQALDEQHLTSDTIALFTSDCGDMLGSQGLAGADVPYEESVRVPLILAYPRVIAAGRRFDFPVSNVDLTPTLLRLCGAEIPAEVQGQDLSTIITAGRGNRPESIYVRGKVGSADEWRMVVRGLDKLVTDRDLNVTHLFNLGTDPWEMQNLVQDSSLELKRDELTALLKDWMRRTGDGMDPSGLKKRSA